MSSIDPATPATKSRARPRVAGVSVIVWALRALAHARRRLRADGIEPMPLVARPPASSSGRGTGTAEAALRLARASCLERAIVMQAWHDSNGRAREIVIGASGQAGSIGAHAWLQGERPDRDGHFTELVRCAPPRRT